MLIYMTVSDSDLSDPGLSLAADEPCCGGATSWMTVDDAALLAARFGALADATRLQVLSIIANSPAGEVCACDFVGPLGKSQPTISHHLKVLSEAGLVEGERRGRWIWYRIATTAVTALCGDLADSVEPEQASRGIR